MESKETNDNKKDTGKNITFESDSEKAKKKPKKK